MGRNKFEELLAAAIRAGADTLQLRAGEVPILRVQGNIVRGSETPTKAEEIDELLRDLLFSDHRARLARGEEVDVIYSSRQGVRFRTIVQCQEKGFALVMRRLPTEAPKLHDLGLPELVNGFAGFRSGIVLVFGFAASGRTSTLAGLVECIHQEAALHIVTIEGRTEFLTGSGHSLIVQREVGMHTQSAAEGIRDAIREGADVVVVGDITDRAAVEAALSAAESGLLVLAAMNGSSIAGGVASLFDMFPGDARRLARARLASVLKVALSQTLLARSHGSGRVPLLEILIANAQVADALRRDALDELPAIMQKARGLGMQTVDAALKGLLAKNQISVDEALYHAVDRDWVLARNRSRG
jgi:twitching motility protein PilT